MQGGDHPPLRREILPVAQLQDQDQRGSGSARGDPPLLHRPTGDRRHPGRKAALRPDLETHGGLADGRRRAGPHHHCHRLGQKRPAVRRYGRGRAFRRLPAPLFRIHRRGAGRTGRRAAAQDGRRRPGLCGRHHRHRTLHPAPVPVQRGFAGQASRGAGHRPPLDLCADHLDDHQPRLCGQAKQGGTEAQLRATDPRGRPDHAENPVGNLRQGEEPVAADRYRYGGKRLPRAPVQPHHGL